MKKLKKKIQKKNHIGSSKPRIIDGTSRTPPPSVTVNVQRIISNVVSKLPNLETSSINSICSLLHGGYSLPFIARYRQREVGKVDENDLRRINDDYHNLIEIEKIKIKQINKLLKIKKIKNQILTKILNSFDLMEIDDLVESVAPPRTKKRSKFEIAQENLQAVQQVIDTVKCQSPSCDHYTLIQKDAATLLVHDIYTETSVRNVARLILSRNCEFLKTTRSHQWLAMRRDGDVGEGWFYIHPRGISELSEKIYKILNFKRNSKFNSNSCQQFINDSIILAMNNHILPFVRRGWISEMTHRAEAECLEVFRKNLRDKLMTPPINGRKRVLGIDPGLANGSKMVIVEESIRILGILKINTINSNELNKFEKFVQQFHPIDLIVLGDGKGSLECRRFLKSAVPGMDVCIITESGASKYSITELSMSELPDLPVEYRGAVSLARRAVDPLAEYVKIDPQHLSVGLYQHDVNQKKLEKFLTEVVTECVASVGVNLNTASASLLRFVPGLNRSTAQAIVEFRGSRGRFHNRRELLEVRGIGPVTYTHSVGFLRVPDSDWTPLDNTAVHPEDYSLANRILRSHKTLSHIAVPGLDSDEMIVEVDGEKERQVLSLVDLGDARTSETPLTVVRAADLPVTLGVTVGRVFTGTVRNVTPFGAFIDLGECGISDDGLLHISQYPQGVKEASHYRINDSVRVIIESMRKDGKGKIRIGLTTRGIDML